MKSIKTKITFAVILCALLSVFICGGMSIINTTSTSLSNSQEKMSLICQNKSQELDSMLLRVAQSVDTLYSISLSNLDDVQKFKTDEEYVDAYTEKMSAEIADFANHTQGAMTAYIRYNPEFTEPTSGAFWTRDSMDGEFQSVTPTDFSMYEKTDTAHVGWYYVPVENQKATWMEPYLNSNINVYMISYVVPLYIDGESIGIVGMDIDFSVFTDVLNETSVFDSGYAYLVNKTGNIMSHKDLEVGSSLADADTGTSTVVEALADENKENTMITYDYEGESKAMLYTTLTNDMKFVLTSPETELQSQAQQMLKVILEGAIAAVIAAVIIGLFLSFRIAKPIKIIGKIMVSTADFNFTHTAGSKKLYRLKDETGRMAHSLHSMRDNLRDMVAKIQKASTDMTETMDSLTRTTVEVSEMSQDNSSTTQELAAAMEETSATMENVNQTIGTVKDRATLIRERSEEGKGASVQIMSRAKELQTTTKQSSQKTTAMYEDVRIKSDQAMEQAKAVEKINELTSAILDISSQTNLLALNASIEAARAGDAGRGFAVVAGEIGQLANQTSSTVGNIKEIIEEVHGAVENMSSCLKNSTDFLEKTVLSDYVGFQKVAEQYAGDADLFERDMTQINGEVEELMNEIVVIADSIEGVNKTVSEAASGVSDIAQKSSEMSQVVQVNNELVVNSEKDIEELKDIVKMFQIEG